MKAPARTVVILTALELEYAAVRTRLKHWQHWPHDAGTLFELGELPGTDWSVAIARTGEGNIDAAVLTERAIAEFRPKALLFVGVAGALHEDLNLGDVVVPSKVYDYHGGMEQDDGFLARPKAWPAPHELEHLARHVAGPGGWARSLPRARGAQPKVHFRPIAAGEVVLNSRTSPLAEQLRRTYNDAAAIEMESAGVFGAGHLNRSWPVLTIRGISDRADGAKHIADKAGLQTVAAANAAAFAFALVEAMADLPQHTEAASRSQASAPVPLGQSVDRDAPAPSPAGGQPTRKTRQGTTIAVLLVVGVPVLMLSAICLLGNLLGNGRGGSQSTTDMAEETRQVCTTAAGEGTAATDEFRAKMKERQEALVAGNNARAVQLQMEVNQGLATWSARLNELSNAPIEQDVRGAFRLAASLIDQLKVLDPNDLETPPSRIEAVLAQIRALPTFACAEYNLFSDPTSSVSTSPVQTAGGG